MGSAHSWLGCGPTGPHSQSPSHALRPGDVRCRWGSACQSAISYLGGGGGRSKGSRNRDRDVSALHLRRNFATGALSLTHHSSHFGHVHVQLYSMCECVDDHTRVRRVWSADSSELIVSHGQPSLPSHRLQVISILLLHLLLILHLLLHCPDCLPLLCRQLPPTRS